MIDTNQVRISFNHGAIMRDFVIFEVRRDNGDYRHSKVPDAALQECRALSVAYDWGNTCYILYRRAEAEKSALKQMLERCDSDVQVREILPDQLAEKQSCRLAQLLCNAIPSLGVGNRIYHNITGKLYYLQRGWAYRRKGELVSFWALQISFTWDCCIKLAVSTFTNKRFKPNAENKPQYLLDEAGFIPRRALRKERENTEDRFVIASLSQDHKNTVPFLEFGSFEEYQSSKVGLLQAFLRDVKTLLTPYLSIELTALDETAHKGTKSTDSMPSIRQRLGLHPLYLEDTVQNEQSAGLSAMLRWELEQYSGIALLEGAPSEDAALIRMIHSKDYYESNDEPDVYAGAPKNCVVQHVTVEDFRLNGLNQRKTREKEDPALRKVIQELAIKLDVSQRQIKCYDWPALGFSGPVTFVTASQDFRKDNRPISYRRLRVMPDGGLRFDAWEQKILWTDLEQEQIALAFETEKGWFDCQVKGVVYEDVSNIHIIRNTERYTLPDMEELERKLKATREQEKLSIYSIAEAIQGELDHFDGAERERCQQVLDKMKECGAQVSRKELKAILNLRTKLGAKLNKLILEETGILIGTELKRKGNRDKVFGGMLDIRHFCEDGVQYYYSGYRGKSLNRSLPYACRIRKVTSTGETLHFERYLPLLEVDFVRTNGWTVIPFPFKYLREWAGLQQFS